MYQGSQAENCHLPGPSEGRVTVDPSAPNFWPAELRAACGVSRPPTCSPRNPHRCSRFSLVLQKCKQCPVREEC